MQSTTKESRPRPLSNALLGEPFSAGEEEEDWKEGEEDEDVKRQREEETTSIFSDASSIGVGNSLIDGYLKKRLGLEPVTPLQVS